MEDDSEDFRHALRELKRLLGPVEKHKKHKPKTKEKKMSTKEEKEQEQRFKDVGVVHEGTKIVLPVVSGKPMDYRTARKWLRRKEEEEEQAYSVFAEFVCSPLDGLIAFMNTLREQYGWVSPQASKSFFGDTPPTMLTVPTGPNGQSEQVPYGEIAIPGIDGHLRGTVHYNQEPKFVLSGEVKRKHQPQIEELIRGIHRNLKENSIYKGRAIKVSFAWEREDEDYHPLTNAPQFMDLDSDLEASLVFSEQVDNDLTVGLWAPIEYSDACRQYQIPLKRGVLLYGPYGTGKTLTAHVAAAKAQRNGWTFIYLDDVRDLTRGLQLAARYAPAVLFAEDIDRVVTGERSPHMDAILNTLDGVDTKEQEIITVFTTNHVENINPAVLRMGRLDSLIEISPPDAEAAQRLISVYARGLIKEGTDLYEAGKVLAGKIPAFIREVVERSKIAAVARLGGGDIHGHVLQEDMIAAAHAMETHHNMFQTKDNGVSDDVLDTAVRKVVHGAFREWREEAKMNVKDNVV